MNPKAKVDEPEKRCLEAMLKRGEAWKCDCEAIVGNFLDSCWHCGRDREPVKLKETLK